MSVGIGDKRSTALATSGLTTVIETPSCAVGDILVAFVASLASGTTVTGPAGWVLVKEFAPGMNLRSAVFSRIVTGTEDDDYTWTWSVSGRTVGHIAAYTGVDLGAALVVDAKAGTEDTTGPHAAPAVTVPDGGWLATPVAARQSPGTAGPVTWTINVGSDTERFDVTAQNVGAGAQLPSAFYDSNGPLAGSVGAPTSAPAPLNAYNELWAGSGAMRVGLTVDKDMVPAWQPRLNGLDWMRIFPNGDGQPPDWTASTLDPRYRMVRDFGAEPFISSKIDGSASGLANLKALLEEMPAWISRCWLTDRHEPEGDISASSYKANMIKLFAMVDTLSAPIRAKVWAGHVLTSQWTENYSGRSYSQHDTGRGRFFGVDKYWNSWTPGTSNALTSYPTTTAAVAAWLERIRSYRLNAADVRPRVFPEVGGVGAPFDTTGAARAAFYRALNTVLRSWNPSNTAWQGDFLGYILWGKQGKSGNSLHGLGEMRWFTLDAHHNGQPYTYTKAGKKVTDPEGNFDLLPNEATGGGGGSVPGARQVTSSAETAITHVWAVALKPAAAPAVSGNAWSAVGVLPLGELSGVSDPVYDAMILADNPEAYWTLDGRSGGLVDQTGNGHDAVNHGATAGLFVTGGAHAFNGTSAYIEVPNDPVFSPVSNPITLEVWMAPDTLTFPSAQGGGDYIHWMGKDGVDPSDDDNAEYVARMYQQNPAVEPARSNRISGYSFNLTPTSGNPGHLGAGSYFQDVLTPGGWLHYVLVINPSTGLVKIYRDGNLRDSDPLSGYAVTPAHGDAPLRFGAASLESFLKGRLARAAFYAHELTRAQIVAHFRQVVPPPPGSAQFVRHTGAAATRVAGTRVRVTVGASGVAAGSTLLADVGHSYTAAGPVMNDSRGNVWERVRTGADGATTIRASQFRCQVKVRLQAGDLIELRTPVSTTARAVTIDEYAGLTFDAVHMQNAVSGNSTTPGTTLTLTTSQGDTLIRGGLTVAGPSNDTYTLDMLRDYVNRGRRGTNLGDGADVWTATVSKNAVPAGLQRWLPGIGTARPWVEIIAAYATGTPVWTPPAQGTAVKVDDVAVVHSSATSSTLVITVGGGDGVPAGHTMIAALNADYTAAAPSVADSAGNTWVVDRTAATTGNAARAAIVSCRVVNALQPGDTITVTWAAAISRKAVLVQDFSGLMAPTVIDVQDGVAAASGSPAQTLTTTVDNTLLVSAVGMAGPTSADYDSDISWVRDPTVGTTGGGSTDRTLYTSHKAVALAAGTTLTPLLQGSYAYASLIVAYRAS